MATNWFWRDGEVENGPVSFHNLVILVKDSVINEDTLVRPEYDREWQYADTAPGLFNMARRVPRERLSGNQQSNQGEAPVGANVVSPEGTAAQTNVLGDPEDLGRWLQGQLSDVLDGSDLVDGSGLLITSGEHPDSHGGNQASESVLESVPAIDGADFGQSFVSGQDGSDLSGDSRMLSAIEAAAEHHDRRTNAGQEIRSWRAFRWLRGPNTPFQQSWIRHGFRWVVAFGMAWLAGSMVNSWAAQESMRYPGFKSQTRTLPLVGECSLDEYAFFTWDFVLGVGIGAYFIARWVEAKCEDSLE